MSDVESIGPIKIIHVIDENCHLIEDFQDQIKDTSLYTSGSNYAIISILGVQGSGKSTLLNMMFGTNFEIMNAKFGRSQTTKGIWLGIIPNNSRAILLMDVEGTDSRERGEDHYLFERKTSLFSLALSDVMLINMWISDVGRHDGANYSLLKVVFELNLQLFQTSKKSKTLILFLFRDHNVNLEPLDSLKRVVEKDIQAIWDSISKDEEWKKSSVGDFFDFQFSSLPHKQFQEELFTEGVLKLRNMFLDPNDQSYLMGSLEKKDIPSDGLPKYISDIWQIIKENKDLNLPSQKEMVSLFRCEQILQLIFLEFCEDLDKIILLNTSQLNPDIGKSLENLVRSKLDLYLDQAYHYQNEAKEIKMADLIEKFQLQSQNLAKIQLRHLNEVMNDFLKQKIKLISKNSSGEEKLLTFEQTSLQIREKSLKKWDEMIEMLNVPTFSKFSYWKFTDPRMDFEETIKNHIEVERNNKLQEIIKKVRLDFKSDFENWLNQWLITNELYSYHAWAKITSKYEKMSYQSYDNLNSSISHLGLSRSTIEEISEKKNTLFFESFRQSLIDIAKTSSWLMERKFKKYFKFDSNGLPRVWEAGQDIKSEYQFSCKSAENILDILSIIRTDPSSRDYSWFLADEKSNLTLNPEPQQQKIPSELIVVDLNETDKILHQFRSQAQSSFVDATHQQQHSNQGTYTVLVAIIMFIIFGWDECIKILTNPIYFIFTIFVGGILVFGYYFYSFGGGGVIRFLMERKGQ